MLTRVLAAVWLRAGCEMFSHERSPATCGRRAPQPARRCAGAPAPRPCDREHEPADAAVALLRCMSQEYFLFDRVVEH